MKSYDYLNIYLGDEIDNNIKNGDYDVIVISLSGGFDSVLVLCKILEKIKNTDTKIIAVKAINSMINDLKQSKEMEAIEKIKKELYALHLANDDNLKIVKNYNFFENLNGDESSGLDIVQTTTKWINQIVNNGITQPGLWINSVIPFLTSKSCIVFGYIQGDDLLSRFNLDNFSKSINSEIGMMSYKLKDNRLSMLLPLAYYNKAMVLRTLKADYPTIYDLCWTCESPYENESECGDCHPCMTKLLADIENQLFHSDDIRIKFDYELPVFNKYKWAPRNPKYFKSIIDTNEIYIYKDKEFKDIIGKILNIDNDTEIMTIGFSFNFYNADDYTLVKDEVTNKLYIEKSKKSYEGFIKINKNLELNTDMKSKCIH